MRYALTMDRPSSSAARRSPDRAASSPAPALNTTPDWTRTSGEQTPDRDLASLGHGQLVPRLERYSRSAAPRFSWGRTDPCRRTVYAVGTDQLGHRCAQLVRRLVRRPVRRPVLRCLANMWKTSSRTAAPAMAVSQVERLKNPRRVWTWNSSVAAQPPASAPATPIRQVMMRPCDLRPGTSIFASRPAPRPRTIHAMMPITDSSVSDVNDVWVAGPARRVAVGEEISAGSCPLLGHNALTARVE